jgi:hypothetical protein
VKSIVFALFPLIPPSGKEGSCQNHDLCESSVFLLPVDGDWSGFSWLLAALSLLLCFGELFEYCMKLTK